MRLLLLLLWFLFIASASFWLPAHDGDIDWQEMMWLVPVYAFIASLAAIGVRRRAQSMREALVSALPAVALLGAIAAWAYLVNQGGEDERGAPIYLYYGIALWSSWAALMLSSALVSRTRWDGIAGIALAFVVGLVALLLATTQVD
jgi:hypothetical protein